MKKRLLILFISIFIISVVTGADSETQSNFTISGCDFGETGLTDGSCSPESDYFCNYENGDYILYNTIYDYFGCSYGAETYTSGQPSCCPIGYVCENEAGGPICNLRELDCSDQLNQEDCEDIGCYWLPLDGGTCIDSPADYSCEIYQNSETCIEDQFKLGQIGIGTEICGTYFTVDDVGYVVPFDSCRCNWGSICSLTYDVLEEFYNGTINSFECTKNFSIGDCIDGSQLITWNAVPQIISGYPSGVPLPVLEAAKCTDNSEGAERDCGIPTLKLFGFSLLSFFISLGTVCLFYFLKELKTSQS